MSIFQDLCKTSENLCVVEANKENFQLGRNNGYGTLILKLNETRLILFNGITETEAQNFNKYCYKTGNYSDFIENIKSKFGLNESNEILYEKKYNSMYGAIRRMKGLSEEWEQI